MKSGASTPSTTCGTPRSADTTGCGSSQVTWIPGFPDAPGAPDEQRWWCSGSRRDADLRALQRPQHHIAAAAGPSAQGVGLVILFPLAIVSNGLVPTQRMPAVLRVIADWNPVSAVTAAARHLFGNPNPSAAIPAWPMQHPVAASLLWSAALLAIFAPSPLSSTAAAPPAEPGGLQRLSSPETTGRAVLCDPRRSRDVLSRRTPARRCPP